MRKTFRHHEYWPSWALYAPVFVDYLRHALRLGNLRYPLVVNPGIYLSGLVGESKWDIYQKLPVNAYPRTHRVQPPSAPPLLETAYPCVAKPDVGERGLGIRFLTDAAMLAEYHARANGPYLIQDYVDLPCEAGIVFLREKERIRVQSLALKRLAEVVGDGVSTVLALCEKDYRFARQIERLRQVDASVPWQKVPAEGERITLDRIRNHRRGSKFEDGRACLTNDLALALDRLVPASTGIFFGRADVRCPSEEHLTKGEGLVIIEINGITGEPAEIYDPQMGLRESLTILRNHWDQIASVAERALAEGQKPAPWRELAVELTRWRRRPAFFYR